MFFDTQASMTTVFNVALAEVVDDFMQGFDSCVITYEYHKRKVK
jgi:hypothetical protein